MNKRFVKLYPLLLFILAVASQTFASTFIEVLIQEKRIGIPSTAMGGHQYLPLPSVSRILEATLQEVPPKGIRVSWGNKSFLLKEGISQITGKEGDISLSAPPLHQKAGWLIPVDLFSFFLKQKYGYISWGKEGKEVRVGQSAYTIRGLRHCTYPDHTRIVMDLTEPLTYSWKEKPNGILFRIEGGNMSPEIKGRAIGDGLIDAIHVRQGSGHSEIELSGISPDREMKILALRSPHRIVADIYRTERKKEPAPASRDTSLPSKRAASQGEKTPAPPGEKVAFGEKAQGVPEKAPVSPKAPVFQGEKAPAPQQAPVFPRGKVVVPPPREKAPVPSQAKAVPFPAAIPDWPKIGPHEEPEEGRKAGSVSTAAAESPKITPQEAQEKTRRAGNVSVAIAEPTKIKLVLDPGHGGKDSGAVGPTGLKEKDVVLDMGLHLKKMVEERLGMEVVMTREDDTFIPLRERAAIANKAKADFFISIHANASLHGKAEGFETFFLSIEASDREAREAAIRENAEIDLEGSLPGSTSNLKTILWDMAQNDFINESSRLAETIQNELDQIQKIPNRGIKTAPFYVLMGAAMPAVLVEVAFISHPEGEKKLSDEAYRESVCEALLLAISEFKGHFEKKIGMERRIRSS